MKVKDISRLDAISMFKSDTTINYMLNSTILSRIDWVKNWESGWREESIKHICLKKLLFCLNKLLWARYWITFYHFIKKSRRSWRSACCDTNKKIPKIFNFTDPRFSESVEIYGVVRVTANKKLFKGGLNRCNWFKRFNSYKRARSHKVMNTWCNLSQLESKTMKLCWYKSNTYKLKMMQMVGLK